MEYYKLENHSPCWIMLPNEPIVFVATSSRHRRDSFESADFLMDYLKSEAPFWKSEKSSGQVRVDRT